MKRDIEGATSGVGENSGRIEAWKPREESAFKEKVSNCVKHAAQRSSKTRTKNIWLDMALQVINYLNRSNFSIVSTRTWMWGSRENKRWEFPHNFEDETDASYLLKTVFNEFLFAPVLQFQQLLIGVMWVKSLRQKEIWLVPGPLKTQTCLDLTILQTTVHGSTLMSLSKGQIWNWTHPLGMTGPTAEPGW